MVKYLQMDGVDDLLQLPSLSFTKVDLDFKIRNTNNAVQIILDSRTGFAWGYTQIDGAGKFASQSGNLKGYLNGSATALANGGQYPIGSRNLLTHIWSTVATDDITIGTLHIGTTGWGLFDIYSVKVYNGSTLVAHYDMSTGTVQDQSGNGNHATLAGGAWVEDADVPTPSVVTGQSTLTGSGVLSASAVAIKGILASASLAATGGISITSRKIHSTATISPTGVGSVSVSGRLLVSRSSSLSSSGTLAISAEKSIARNGLVAYYHSSQGVNGSRWVNLIDIGDQAYLEDVVITQDGKISTKGNWNSRIRVKVPSSVYNVVTPWTFEFDITMKGAWVDGYFMPVINSIPAGSTYLGLETSGTWAEFPPPVSGESVGVWVEKTPGLELETHYHITFVYDGNTNFKWYVNGTLAYNTTTSSQLKLANDTQFLLGADGTSEYGMFRIYNHALTAQEIADNYSVGDNVGLSNITLPNIVLASTVLSGTGGVTAVGGSSSAIKPVTSGPIALNAASGVTAVGESSSAIKPVTSGPIALNGQGVVSSASRLIRGIQLTLSGQGVVSSTPRAVRAGSIGLSGLGSMATSFNQVTLFSASLSATSGILSNGIKMLRGVVISNGTSVFTSSGIRITSANAGLTAEARLFHSDGGSNYYGVVSLSSTGTLRADSTKIHILLDGELIGTGEMHVIMGDVIISKIALKANINLDSTLKGSAGQDQVMRGGIE